MAGATVELTAGRVSPKDLRVPFALAAAAGAKDLLLTADGTIVFRTDEVRARIPFAGRPWEGEQNCWVNRAGLARVVRACKGRDMLLEPTVAGGLSVVSDALTVTLPRVLGDPVEHPEGDELLTIEARELARGLLRAEPFAGRDQTRPVLWGVALDLENGKVVATDSYRLTVVDLPGIQHPDTPPLILPLRVVKALSQVLASHAGDVTLRLLDGSDRHLVVVVGDQRWTIKLTRGKYPDWQELLAHNEGKNNTEFELDASELADAASLIADGYAITGCKARHAPLVMTVATGKVTVQTRFPECIEVRQELDATGDVREPVEMGFHPRFLADAMQAISPDRARLSIGSPLRPLVATAPDGLFLVMPIRLNV